MKRTQSILMGTGSVVLAGLILTLLAPKAVRAVVATAVQVMNTPASPVPNKDVDESARMAFTAYCERTANSTFNSCSINVPPGKIFVVETVSFFASGKEGFIGYSSGGTFGKIYLPLTSIGNTYEGTSPLRLYVDPGTVIGCQSDYNSAIDNLLQCTLSGHLVSTP